MKDPFARTDGYESLSIKDLLEAREIYHNLLCGKPNVIGTAVGLYLIRDSEHAERTETGPSEYDYGTLRTFQNAHVRDDSEPCLLVLVRAWLRPEQFGHEEGQARMDDIIPSRLELPDGRIVPVCVVAVSPAEIPHDQNVNLNWPSGVAGGGFPLLVMVQGVERVASAGCLVTDGHTTYALTNRHVCGNPGEPVFTLMRGKRELIGRSSHKQLTRLPFERVYPSYAASRSYAALDVGLIALENVNDWTSQVYGIGAPGELIDLSDRTFSLRMIGAPLIAHGAASGPLDGRIAALFYRYKSIGGFDWLADFLIAPASDNGPQTRPGDSGTIWFAPAASGDDRARPLAIQWGGQSLLEGAGKQITNFALATALSTVCNLLDVDVMSDHNTGYARYWGSEGHYTIAARACGYLQTAPLAKFMNDHADLIAFDVASKDPDEIKSVLQRAADNEFIPLADVPDIVWKQSPNKVPGGRDTQVDPHTHRATGPEHPTHYADVDQTRSGSDVSLRQMSLNDPDTNLTVPAWQAFYDSVGATQSSNRGLLPFRCWQFFDTMVDAIQHQHRDVFLCAAGILAHYVGDACQPLHGSIYSDGYPDDPLEHTVHHKDESTEVVKVKRGAGVHSAYEEAMIDLHAKDLLQKMQEAPRGTLPARVASGHEAALSIMQLMQRTAVDNIDPKTLVDAYIAAGGGKSKKVLDALWHQFGDKTVACMEDGARVLAMLWESAWAVAGGLRDPGQVTREQLQAIYEHDAKFAPSLDLNHVGPALRPVPHE